MIGSFLVDVILEKNANDDLNCTVYALGRNEKKSENDLMNFLIILILSSYHAM